MSPSNRLSEIPVNITENRLLAEETVRPIPFLILLILWPIGVYLVASAVAAFSNQPHLNEPLPDWVFVFGDQIGTIFASCIVLFLATLSTVIFILFRGVRYRIFTDRIEFQQGKHPRFGPVQTLFFDELNSIFWDVQGRGSENPYDSTFLEFHFASRTFQLHKNFDLSGQVAEACKTIERETIAPKILRSLEGGKTVEFLRPDKFPPYEIRIDKERIQDWDQHRFLWDEIRTISFSKGKASGYGNFLAQSRIRIENSSKEAMEFDMPRHNPYAFWAVLTDQCKSSDLQVLNFPKSEGKN